MKKKRKVDIDANSQHKMQEIGDYILRLGQKISQYIPGVKTDEIRSVISRSWITNVLNIFDSSGKIGIFQKWQPLTPRWLARKKKMGARTEILRFRMDGIRQGLMKTKITLPTNFTGRGTITLSFPSLPSYAIYHQRRKPVVYQKGNKTWTLPRRDFLRWDDKFVEEIQDVLKKELKEDVKIKIIIEGD